MAIDHKKFKQRSEAIRSTMLDLHINFDQKEGIHPRDIHKLAQAFQDRDKDVDTGLDLEILTLMRGFVWGMDVYNQIVKGNNLHEH